MRQTPYLHKEGALQKAFLDVFRVALLTFVQAPQPVIIGCTISVKTVTDFEPNAMRKIVSLPSDRREEHLHRVFPIVLDWAQEPSSGIILESTKISVVKLEGRVRWTI